jgi:drug/metabolite transporter (DMT)-like permease
MSAGAIALCRWTTLAVILNLLLRNQKFRNTVKAKTPSRPDGLKAILVGIFLFAPAHVLYYSALGKTSTVVGAVLNATAPSWTALFALIFLSERFPLSRWIALFAGSIGAYIVAVGLTVPSFRAADTQSNLLYLLGTMLECLGSVFAMRLVRRSSGLTILAGQISGGVLTFALAPLLLGDKLPIVFPSVWSWPAFASVSYLVLISGLLCFGVWYTIAERAPLSFMVVTILVQPIASTLLGILVKHEPFTIETALGSGLILVALLIASHEGAKAKA